MKKRLLCIILIVSLCLPYWTCSASALEFQDVSSRSWYYKAVCYVSDQGYMIGTASDQFSPSKSVTRGMFVTILYRMSEDYGNFSGIDSGFDDVKSGRYYSDAVTWAVATGVTKGTSATTFEPETEVTREQIACFVSRFLNAYNITLNTVDNSVSSFTDADSVSSWAASSLETMLLTGIILGDTNGTLRPADSATRAEAAAIIQRMDLAISEVKYDGDNGTYETYTNSIVYVPVDDRPVNTDRILALADTMNMELIMPDQRFYQTVIAAYTSDTEVDCYGDSRAIAEYLLEMYYSGYRNFIISLDQLYSGGLLSSRVITDEISEETIIYCQGVLKTLLSDPDNTIILIDSILRLATSADYFGYDLITSNATRAYGMQSRATVDFSEMTIDNYEDYFQSVIDNYTTCNSSLTTGTMLEETYLAVRQRKLGLAVDTLFLVANASADVTLYSGIDDSSSSDDIQTNEIAYLNQLAQILSIDKFDIQSGIDEYAALTLVCLAEKISSAYQIPTVATHVYGSLSNAADQYTAETADAVLTNKMNILGVTESATADIVLLVFSKNGDIEAAMAEYISNMQNGIYTIVLDLTSATFGLELLDNFSGLSIQYLLAYSSWGTTANRIGLSLAEGIGHYLALQEGNMTDDQRVGYATGLVYDVLIDLVYRAQCNRTIDVNALASTTAMFSGKAIADFTIGTIRLAGISLPWNRSFEVRLKIDIRET